MKKSKKGFVYAAIAILLWSTVASAFKLTLKQTSYSELLFISVLVSLLFFIGLNGYRKNWKLIFSMHRPDLLWLVLSGLLNPAVYYFVLFRSYSLLPAQIAQPLNYTWPVWLMILGYFFLKQKFSYWHIPSLVLGFAGVFVLSYFQPGDVMQLSIQGIKLALGSAWIWAAYWILNLRIKQKAEVKLLIGFTTGFIAVLCYLLLSHEKLTFSLPAIYGGIYTGLFEMGITFFVWLKALENFNNKALLGNLIFLTPFLSFVFIQILVHEKITSVSLAGLTLIIIGILVQNLATVTKLQKKINN